MIKNIRVNKEELQTLSDNNLLLERMDQDRIRILKVGNNEPLVELIYHNDIGSVLISDKRKYEWVDKVTWIFYCGFYRTIYIYYEQQISDDIIHEGKFTICI